MVPFVAQHHGDHALFLLHLVTEFDNFCVCLYAYNDNDAACHDIAMTG